MLAIFNKGLVDPPKELKIPAGASPPPPGNLVPPRVAVANFNRSSSSDGFSLGFGDRAFLAFSSPNPNSSSPFSPQRLFCGVNEMYCIFLGSLNNLCSLNRQYGLSSSKGGNNEAMLVIEAYRTLRDRGPYPAHQVLNDLEGSFGFVIYDHKSSTVFAALGVNESLKLYWGIAEEDGSVMISDNVQVIKDSCGRSFAPFPNGCMYHSEKGLMSFEHPMKEMMAMTRVDSEGAMCGALFKVDPLSKSAPTIPRVGSEANWTI
ncbi:unnamed protein product [Cuscuta campestris]|uniref:DUF3700 domain-containing protein n=1 Tax=Cuscuta campestris TaxID=132261 RepID=A0A484MKG7_9ASTE|nr:unnamed protein product [Cuscuta campestris]